jgi:Fe-S-cluster-containing dehydrogenase component
MVPVEEGRWWEKRVRGCIQCKKCVHMCINAKMIPIETIPGRKRGIKRVVEMMNSSMI